MVPRPGARLRDRRAATASSTSTRSPSESTRWPPASPAVVPGDARAVASRWPRRSWRAGAPELGRTGTPTRPPGRPSGRDAWATSGATRSTRAWSSSPQALAGRDRPLRRYHLVLAGGARFVDEAGTRPRRRRWRRSRDSSSGWGGSSRERPSSRRRRPRRSRRQWPESFGLVAAEAMSCRTSVRASRDAGALAEVVGADHPWVVPKGDAHALAPGGRRRLRDRPGTQWRGRSTGPTTGGRSDFSPTAGLARVAALVATSGSDPRAPQPRGPRTLNRPGGASRLGGCASQGT